MKSSIPLNKVVLLVTTMLFTPSIAAAQAQEPTSPPPAGSDQASDEEFGDEEEIVVLGRNIPQPMRETSEVVTVLSAEDLARQGDDNAALALTRLSGLSVASGGFVFVRGLGDRYSFALLNGSPLPSPEPLRRQVPLDMFPSNILDGATVQKTFSTNYPGEFGGGIIDLRTVRIPTDPFLTIKAGTGGNTEAWSGRGLTYYGERSDWSGIADGLRDIPGPLAAAISRGQRIQDTNFTAAELEVIGESFANSPLTVVQRDDLQPDFEGEVTAGTSFDLGRYNLVLVGVVGYDSAMRTQRAERETVIDNGTVATYLSRFNSVGTTWDVVFNAFGSASVGWGTNEVALTGLLVRSTSKDAQIQEGFNIDDASVIIDDPSGTMRHNESTGWYERQLASIQFSGEHGFGDLDVDWRTAFAQSTRDAPYERSVSYILPAPPAEPILQYSAGAGDNSTRFSYLTDEVASAGIDASYTVPLSNQRDVVFSAGVDYSNTVRSYELLTFSFTGSAPQDVLRARVDYLFSPDNISPLRFEIAEFTGRDDAYKGRLTVNAAYAAADVEVLPLLRASVGVRYEDSTQIVRTGNRFGETPSAPVTIEETYFLPATTLTWNFAEDIQLRLGYSQTIARPQFRELALTPYLDPETDRIYQGNPGLVNSEFQNYDARLEYYLGADQFITVGGFYKQINDPIEEVIVLSTNSLTQTRFINAPEATLYGAELEYRTHFDMPFELPYLSTARWLFAANYTYTFSEVQADAGSTVINPSDGLPVPASNFGLDGSQLQGTPENIVNLQFGLETDDSQLTMLINWVDERILRRGLGQLPVVLENPGTIVDLVYRKNFQFGGSVVTFGLSGRNLLDEAHEEYQNSSTLGQTNINTYDRGRSFSVSLTAKY